MGSIAVQNLQPSLEVMVDERVNFDTTARVIKILVDVRKLPPHLSRLKDIKADETLKIDAFIYVDTSKVAKKEYRQQRFLREYERELC